jgi:DNA-directed RNA polymerase subunit RPC12/RpoP
VLTIDNNNKYKCEFCGTEISWDSSHPYQGHIWECEKCSKIVCSKCIEDAGSSVSKEADQILCPECNNKIERIKL